MNPSSSTYKTLKYTFQIRDSQWWVTTVSFDVCFFFSCAPLMCLMFCSPPELHIRVPLWDQWIFHKHSFDKNLQDEVRTRWDRPFLLWWPRNHELYRVSAAPGSSVAWLQYAAGYWWDGALMFQHYQQCQIFRGNANVSNLVRLTQIK